MKNIVIGGAVLLGLLGGGVYFAMKAANMPESAKAAGPQGTAAKQVAAMATAPDERGASAVLAGEWTGKAPWAATDMSFSIAPDGTFVALDTHGTWTESNGLYVLKFADDHSGARYEGRVEEDVFSGTAFSPDGEQKPFRLERQK